MSARGQMYPRQIMPLLALLALVVSASVAWPASALDLNAQFEFRIAPQKLTTALVELSRQANAQVVSDTTEVDRFDSSGINGRMALKDALQALLDGTNLDYRVTDKGVIAIGVFAGRSSRRAAGAGPALIPYTAHATAASMARCIRTLSTPPQAP